jgi:hypothetical protein
VIISFFPGAVKKILILSPPEVILSDLKLHFINVIFSFTPPDPPLNPVPKAMK